MKITKKQIIATAVSMATLFGLATSAQAASAAEVNVYRLYNKVSQEHLYTASKYEYDTLPTKSRDWVREGVNFREYNSASANTKAVNRVYNPRSGEHIYTQDTYEVKVLTSQRGWKSEGVAFHAPKTSSKPVYRVFNAAAGLGAHFVTGDGFEKNSLVSRGWKYEGVAWYALAGTSGGDNGGGNTTPPTTTFTGWAKNRAGQIIWQKGGFATLVDAARAAADWSNENNKPGNVSGPDDPKFAFSTGAY
ncbi:MAG: hypothetical protein ACRCSC_01805 [Lactococcus garvieae]